MDSIRCQTQRVNDLVPEQIGITESKALGTTLVAGSRAADRQHNLCQVIWCGRGRRVEQVPAEYGVFSAPLVIDSSDRHVLVCGSRHSKYDSAAWIRRFW